MYQAVAIRLAHTSPKGEVSPSPKSATEKLVIALFQHAATDVRSEIVAGEFLKILSNLEDEVGRPPARTTVRGLRFALRAVGVSPLAEVGAGIRFGAREVIALLRASEDEERTPAVRRLALWCVRIAIEVQIQDVVRDARREVSRVIAFTVQMAAPKFPRKQPTEPTWSRTEKSTYHHTGSIVALRL